MSPLSGWVLGPAAVVASPALWSTFVDQTMPLEVGLTRVLIATGISWLLISLVAEMAFPAPGSVRPATSQNGAGSEQAPEPAPPSGAGRSGEP